MIVTTLAEFLGTSGTGLGTEGAGYAVVGGKLWVAGGRDSNGALGFNGMWSYDPATDTWAGHASIPEISVVFPACAAVGTKIYFFGGSTSGLDALQPNPVQVYDTIANTWRQITNYPPVGVAGAMAVTVGTKIYVIGGRTISPTATSVMQVFDTITETWASTLTDPTNYPALPLARFDGAAAVVGGKIWVFGGYDSNFNAINNTFTQVFDPATRLWSTKPALPIVLTSCATVVIGNLIYFIGGNQDGSYTGGIRVYDTVTGLLATEPLSTTAASRRIWPAAGVISSVLYVAGGEGDTTGTVSVTGLELPPFHATPISPASGTFLDMANPVTMSWKFNVGPGGGVQAAYALARRSGIGGVVQYWNAATASFQTTRVNNAGAATSVTTHDNGNGNQYSWAVDTQDSVNSLWSGFTADQLFVGQAAPVTTITAPAGTLNTFTVSVNWSSVFPAGAAQIAYHVVIYNVAQYTDPNFVPGVTPGLLDTGAVGGTAVSVLIPISTFQNNATYRAYLQVTETGGETNAWQYTEFTIKVDAPAQPEIVALPSFDLATGAPRVSLAVNGLDNLLTEADASLEVGIYSYVDGQNCTVSRTPPDLLGQHYLRITNTANGDAWPLMTAHYAITEGQTYSALASFQASTTARGCSVDIDWFDINDVDLLVPSVGVTTFDRTGAMTQCSVVGTAPVGAASMRIRPIIHSAASGEIHFIDKLGVFAGITNIWTRGGLIGATTGLIEYTDDGSTWKPVRDASALALSSRQAATVYDYESSLNVPRSYRVRLLFEGGPVELSSPLSVVVTAMTSDIRWWIKNPLDPSKAISFHLASNFQGKDSEKTTAKMLLGRTTPVFVSDGFSSFQGTSLVAQATSKDQYDKIRSAIKTQSALLIQSPFGYSWYARVNGDRAYEQEMWTLDFPFNKVSMTFVEVDAP